MLQTLIDAGRTLLVEPSCPLCQKHEEASTGGFPCLSCRTGLNLPYRGLSGEEPLHWIALGLYTGGFRQLLLRLRSHPRQRSMRSLILLLDAAIPEQDDIELVPIPSWKRHRHA